MATKTKYTLNSQTGHTSINAMSASHSNITYIPNTLIIGTQNDYYDVSIDDNQSSEEDENNDEGKHHHKHQHHQHLQHQHHQQSRSRIEKEQEQQQVKKQKDEGKKEVEDGNIKDNQLYLEF